MADHICFIDDTICPHCASTEDLVRRGYLEQCTYCHSVTDPGGTLQGICGECRREIIKEESK